MSKLRDLIDKTEKYSKFKLNISLIETALEEGNNNSVIESSKGLLESVCKTISGDLGIKISGREDLPKITKLTVESLPFIKSLEESDSEKTKVLCGNIITLSKTLSELRNKYGFISHGPDVEYSKKADFAVANLAYNVTDLLCSFLLELHTNFSTIRDLKRFSYEQHEEFNIWFDELQELPVKIGQLEFSPSKVLYNEDFEAYKEELLEYQEQLKEEENN